MNQIVYNQSFNKSNKNSNQYNFIKEHTKMKDKITIDEAMKKFINKKQKENFKDVLNKILYKNQYFFKKNYIIFSDFLYTLFYIQEKVKRLKNH